MPFSLDDLEAFNEPVDEKPKLKGKAKRPPPRQPDQSENTAPPPEDPGDDDDDYHLPIASQLPEGKPFPVDYLPPILKKAVKAIASLVQVPEALAAQSVLGAAALACQSLADVSPPKGPTSPLSLYLVSLAVSGDRKSSTDKIAMKPFTARVDELRADYDMLRGAYDIAIAVWEAERKAIMGGKGKTSDQKKYELSQMARKPEPPLMPRLLVGDTTLEALLKHWPKMPGSVGLFCNEGGMFIGGYSMRGDGKIAGGATLSLLWDGEPVDRMRAGEDDAMPPLYGRRLSMHLLIQPQIAVEFLTNTILLEQGLHSRILLSMPPSRKGTRLYQEDDPHAAIAVQAYTAHILDLLRKPWPLAEHSLNELRPRVLGMEADAKLLWIEHYEVIEKELKKDGKYADIASLGDKAAAITARIAAIFSLVEDADAEEVTAMAMRNSIEVMEWYLDEAVRVRGWATSARAITGTEGEAYAVQRIEEATVKFLEWLKGQAAGQKIFRIRRRDIMRNAIPHTIRKHVNLQPALATLALHGYIEPTGPNDDGRFITFNL